MIPPVIDSHTDLVLAYQQLKDKFNTSTSNTQTSLPLLKQANVKALFAGFSYDDLLHDSYQQLEDTFEMLEKFSTELELIHDFKTIENINTLSKIAVVLHLEGSKILEGDMNNLHKLYERGLRSLGITHNTKNSLGTGAAIDNEEGLSSFGKEVIKECNKLKVVVDLSHLNQRGFYDALRTSNKPVIVSHANCYEIAPHPRNLRDEQLKEIAKIGSFVGIFFSGKYLNPDLDGSKATIENALDHIQHMVEIMGIDHVAIGSDFGGITTGLPKGLENHASLLIFFERLKQKGFSNEGLEKIAYKNVLRVLRNYS